MSALEVMDLVKTLPERDVLDLGRMLDEWTAELVDRRVATAVESGAFEAMADEALRELEAGKTVPLDEVLDNSGLS